MKYIVAVYPFFIMVVILSFIPREGVFPKPEISLKLGNKSYDFVNRQAYADIYLVKGVTEECDKDTCYQEHTVKLYCLKKDVVTNTVVDRLQVPEKTIAANTTPTTTFIGKMLINDYKYYYEYYVDAGDSYKAINSIPITLRYFPNKHLQEGYYAIQFDSDSCFKGKITIFRGSSATENAKTLNHRVRIYYKVGINGNDPEEFSTVMDVNVDSLTESVTFVRSAVKDCNYISFYQVTGIEIEG